MRRTPQRGQGAVEYVGLVVVVAAIVAALVGTGVGPALAEGISTQVCRITGGGDCGGGSDTVADGDQGDQGAQGNSGGQGDSGGQGGEEVEAPADSGGKTQAELDYDAALKELQDAQAAEKSDGDKAKEAAKELAKILADELGITDALDCITKGDMGACTETLINVLLSVVGGAVGKLAAKYGAPWKWKKAVELVKKLKKHGGDLYDGLKGLIKNRKRVDDAEDGLADAKRKLDQENKDKPRDGDKPEACPVRHSFLPGTPVLLADGRRAAIETVRAGQWVTVTEPSTGLTTARRVVRAITTHDDKEFTRLTVRSDSGTAVLTATDTHPFWLSDQRRWADAGDIRPGATFRTSTGGALRVLDTDRYTKRQTTHDLSVEGIHTYYVGVGAQEALVHNNDPCDNPDYDEDPDFGITDKKHGEIDKRHGADIADGVDYNVKRIKSKDQPVEGETPEQAAQRIKNANDHIIPGTNGDPTKMAEYFAKFRDKEFTHHDPRPPDPSRPNSQSDALYDDEKGVVILKNGTMVHGYKMTRAEFDRIYSKGAKRN
ncbi:polymorphic toxin-type HINT domain-containing protein [Streptomyces sp. NP-1717]|uniref:polymorphic toxin-type HINT domain-containing protein n=1 Tax=Streptomyces sp. NP-1717 TaxID=2704470 RepID=UPI001F5CCBA9|nr:polymorphic toxin-type HINT domain-containing protein [Streptomyces sp. NP-1717]